MQHAHHILLPLYFAVAAIGSAFVPVVNAFFVMAIALLLFSMFGVDLFKHVRSVRLLTIECVLLLISSSTSGLCVFTDL